MRTRGLLATLAALLTVLAASENGKAWGQEKVRRYTENGVEYVEFRRKVREPVVATRVEENEQTVYKEQLVTEIRESEHLVYSPVTEYCWEPRVHGILNPFRPRTVAYHLVPRTRWEARTHTVRRPVTVRQLTPETRVVQKPVRELTFADREEVSRMAVNSEGSSSRVAAKPKSIGAVGGVLKMDGDHPRHGLRTNVSGGRY